MIINEIFKPLFGTTKRYCIVYGATGSGKSVGVSQYLISSMLNEYPNKILVARKFGTTLRNSVYDTLLKIIYDNNLDTEFNWTQAPMEITCKRNGNRIIFTGLDDVMKLKSITDVSKIWVEEADETSFDDFKILNTRLRGDSQEAKKIILTFNPTDVRSWIRTVFFIENHYLDNTLILHAKMDDNKFLSEEDVQEIRNTGKRDAYYNTVYVEGNWGSINENKIFSNYVVDETIETDIYGYSDVYIGIDFGFNHPSVILLATLIDDEIIIFKEHFLKRFTNDKLITTIVQEVPNEFLMIADSAEPQRIKEMRQSGIRVIPSIKGKNSVKDGIDFIRRRKVKIHPSCTNTIREFGNYRYLTDTKSGEIYDEPIGVDDDCIAALRYAIEPIRRNLKITAGLRPF